MPRIPAIVDKTGLSAADQAILDSIMGSRGKIVGPFPLLMHAFDNWERPTLMIGNGPPAKG